METLHLGKFGKSNHRSFGTKMVVRKDRTNRKISTLADNFRRIQPFRIEYRKGSDNVPDALSDSRVTKDKNVDDESTYN